jgi:hypothetical protein
MDEESKLRFDDVGRNILTTNARFDDQSKRLDDVKWMVGGTSAIFAVIFSVITLVAGWNYNSALTQLHDFEEDIKRQLLKIDDTKLELFNVDGSALSGQAIIVKLEKDPYQQDRIFGNFSFMLRNSGETSSGDMFIKVYSSTGFELNTPSSDEKQYNYEFVFVPESLHPVSVPGGMSIIERMHLYLPNPESIKPVKYDGMIKVYYGRGRMVSAPVFWNVSLP